MRAMNFINSSKCNECLLPVLIRGQLVPNAERATPRFSKAGRVATVLQLVSNVSVFAVKPYGGMCRIATITFDPTSGQRSYSNLENFHEVFWSTKLQVKG